MKNIIAINFLFLVSIFSFSQKERNIWYFGNHAGLDFNSGSPIALTNSAMFLFDNSTSVADNNGSLLFYSNGVDVWNKNHIVMPNGSGLFGNNSGGNCAFAVKQPGSSTIYYLFTVDQVPQLNGLCYSVIDMSLQGGLGDVTSTKNVQLLNPSTEKITAVKHSNNKDIWIITHSWNSNAFNVYLLTSAGLNNTPVVSMIGSVHTGGQNGTYNAMGEISASQNGKKLVCAIYNIDYELFDFNNSTGVLSNLINISGYPNAWGTEFSPDGTKLYTTQWTYSGIYQFDLSSNNQTTINSSATVIGTATSPDPNYKAGYLQLGPDQKIYVAKFTSGYVGVIDSPNLLGTLCNYIDNGVSLGGKFSEAGFPSFMQTNCSPIIATISSNSTICVGSNVSLSASGGTNYTWSTGATTSVILSSPIITTTYSVIVSGSCGSDTASATVTVSPPPVAVVTSATICSGQNATLTASGGGNYSWNNSSTASSITVSPTITSTYSVVVSNGSCSDTTSAIVIINPNPTANVSGSISIHQGQTTTLTTSGGTNYLWNNGETTTVISVAPTVTTIYCVTITDTNNCTDTACTKVYVESPCDTAGIFFFPNAFSPNSDDENDVLKIYYHNMNCIKTFTLNIYDRWGEQVFETTDKTFQWDGIYQNKILNTQVLTYYLSVVFTDSKAMNKKGNISLLR